MTLVMNQLLDSKLTEANDEEEKGGKSTEKKIMMLCYYGIMSRFLIQKKVL